MRARGIDFHVAEAGAGDDVVLCLHGWPQHWYEWRHLIAALRDEYHVICPDLRGFGWSAAPSSGYEKEQLVDDIIGIMDRLGIERVRLIGHAPREPGLRRDLADSSTAAAHRLLTVTWCPVHPAGRAPDPG